MTWPAEVTESRRRLLTDALDGRLDRTSLVPRLEAALAGELGQPEAAAQVIAVASGTAALHVVLTALGAGPGREVVVPGYGWVSVGGAAAATGATVRIAPTSTGLTPSWADIRPLLGPRTAAVVLAHVHGAPAADAPAVAAGVARAGVPLVEDCAQAWGMRPTGWRPGRLGAAAVLSMHSAKLVSAEEGGAAYLADPELARAVRHAVGDRAVLPPVPRWRLGLRMSWMQAAMALPDLAVLPVRVARLRSLRDRLLELLPAGRIRRALVPPPGDVDNGTHLTVELRPPELAVRLSSALRMAGFGVGLPLGPGDEHHASEWPGGAVAGRLTPGLLDIRVPLCAEEEDPDWVARFSRALGQAGVTATSPVARRLPAAPCRGIRRSGRSSAGARRPVGTPVGTPVGGSARGR